MRLIPIWIALLFQLLLPALAWPSSGCLSRAHQELIAAYGELPNVDLPGKHSYFPEVMVLPPEAQEKLGIKKISIKDKLGQGGMGSVYLVEVEGLDGVVKKMAWKEVNKEASASSGSHVTEHSGMTLQYVALQASKERSPQGESYIVPVHSKFTIQDRFGKPQEAYLMDLAGRDIYPELGAPGELSLYSGTPGGRLKSNPGNRIRKLARLAHDLSKGLAEISQSQVVHNDLKPPNIVITGGNLNDLSEVMKGQAHFAIIDFGLSVPTGYKSDWVFGTPGFISPDKVHGTDPHFSAATDVFSMASVLAEGVFGVSPSSKLDPQLVKVIRTKSTTPDKSFTFTYFNQDEVIRRIPEIVHELKSQGVSPEDLRIFHELADFISRGLDPHASRRLSWFQDYQSSILRLSKDGSKIMGPSPEFTKTVKDAVWRFYSREEIAQLLVKSRRDPAKQSEIISRFFEPGKDRDSRILIERVLRISEIPDGMAIALLESIQKSISTPDSEGVSDLLGMLRGRPYEEMLKSDLFSAYASRLNGQPSLGHKLLQALQSRSEEKIAGGRWALERLLAQQETPSPELSQKMEQIERFVKETYEKKGLFHRWSGKKNTPTHFIDSLTTWLTAKEVDQQQKLEFLSQIKLVPQIPRPQAR